MSLFSVTLLVLSVGEKVCGKTITKKVAGSIPAITPRYCTKKIEMLFGAPKKKYIYIYKEKRKRERNGKYWQGTKQDGEDSSWDLHTRRGETIKIYCERGVLVFLPKCLVPLT